MDIGGLAENTTYYYTCTSYCDALGWGSSYNINTKTKVPTISPSASDISLTYPMWTPYSAYNSRYGCFGGGRGRGGFDWIDAFNPSLSKTNPARTTGTIVSAFGNENHFLFGIKDNGHDAYNTSLVKTRISGFQGRMTALPSYILGIVDGTANTYALSSSLSVTKISRGFSSDYPAVTHIGNYAIIAGGCTQYNPDRWTTRIVSINNSLTSQVLAYGKEGDSGIDNICMNDYGIYRLDKGGYPQAYLYCFNKSLSYSLISASNYDVLSGIAATAGGKFAVFLQHSPSIGPSGVCKYQTLNNSLASSSLQFTQSKIPVGYFPGATQVGDFAMFTGFSQETLSGPAVSASLLFKVQ